MPSERRAYHTTKVIASILGIIGTLGIISLVVYLVLKAKGAVEKISDPAQMASEAFEKVKTGLSDFFKLR